MHTNTNTDTDTDQKKHPVKLPVVMYELMWNVTEFSNRADWPADGKPFRYSMDLGGSAAHGDYVFGWKDDTLQRAMDGRCNLNQPCPQAGLTVAQPAEYNACKVRQQAPEPVDGCELFFFLSCACDGPLQCCR